MPMNASTVAFLIIIVGIIVFAALDMSRVKIDIPFIGNITTGNETAKQYTIDVGEIRMNVSVYTPLLYQNIRFGEMPIKFYLDVDSAQGITWFGEQNVNDVIEAFGMWSNATDGKISFARTLDKGDAQITVNWNISIASNATDARAVGEGGPSMLVDTGLFNLTLKGSMHILPAGTKCIDVNRALHELGHVLGLDHSEDPYDVMYPYESCIRSITQSDVKTLESIYSMEPKPQLAVSNVSAIVRGGYIDLNFSVENRGILSSPQTKVAVYSDNKSVADADIDSLKPGAGLFEYFRNVKITYGSKEIRILVDPDGAIDMWYRNLTYAVIPLE